jgi:hypothetical protein
VDRRTPPSVLFNYIENFHSEDLGSEVVTMVQTAESRHGYDPASCIRNPHFFTTCRRSLPQRKMRPVGNRHERL